MVHHPHTAARPSGFTMVEMLVVIALIIVLMSLLFPALSAVRTQSRMANSMSNMRQIGTFMRTYEGDHRDMILPSQFDYSELAEGGSYVGRAAAPVNYEGNPVGFDYDRERHRGTWADILWERNGLGRFQDLHAGPGEDGPPVDVLPHDYRRVAPDHLVYEELGFWTDNVLRSVSANTRDANPSGDGIALPYGDGAHAEGLPGYFAANNFFDARPDAADMVLPDGTIVPPPPGGRWYTMGQIRSPSRSIYLVDSFYGEIIEPEPGPWDNTAQNDDDLTIQVDFRYGGVTLMLLLDGSTSIENRWRDICQLEVDRQRRVRILDRRGLPEDCAVGN